MAIQFTLETVQKTYNEQSVQAKNVLKDASSFLEELARRVGMLKRQVLFNPYAQEIPLHLSKLTQVRLEMGVLERNLQDISPKDKLWQQCRDNIKQLSTQSSTLKDKIEELSYVFSTHVGAPRPIQQSLFDTFSPSASPSSSLTLKDLMAFETSPPQRQSLIQSRSNPHIDFAEGPPDPIQDPEDSDEDGYLAEVPIRSEDTRMSSLKKKSRSIESGMQTLLAESENHNLEEDSIFGFDDVDAGQFIGIHIDYIQDRATLFNERSPRDLDYSVLDNYLSATYRHAGKFLFTINHMTPAQLRHQNLDRISLREVLDTLIQGLRIMHAAGRRAITNPKNLTQAKIYGGFIERECLRIECVTKRMLAKIKEIEISFIPLIATIDSATHYSFPSVLTRLIIQYLTENE